MGASPLVTLSETVEKCLEGQSCDEKSAQNCAAAVALVTVEATESAAVAENATNAVKGVQLFQKQAKRVRLIKGKRASNWRPRIDLSNENNRALVDKFRDRLIAQRRRSEQFLDTVLSRQNTKDKKPTKQSGKYSSDFSSFCTFLLGHWISLS